MITNPQVVDELTRIAETSEGQLRAEDVVEAAREASSPLHTWFQWDDTKAAQEYRLTQARQLIRVTVSYAEGKKSEPTRIFVSLSTDRTKGSGGGYRSLHAVMSSEEMRRQLLADAMEDAKRFRLKYQSLKELAAVFDAITVAEHSVGSDVSKELNEAGAA